MRRGRVTSAFTACVVNSCVFARAFSPLDFALVGHGARSSRVDARARSATAPPRAATTAAWARLPGSAAASLDVDAAEQTNVFNLTAARLAGVRRRQRGGAQQRADELRSVSRSKLTPHDAADYHGKSLFCEFARVLCSLDGVVPRKELHEAWEAALLIHAAFPAARRVADLASGNGLLSWALLVLGGPAQGRSVLCVDKVQPPSFVTIANAMISRWPWMRARHRYVEASLLDARLQPQADVLLVCLHGCGTLSDQVLHTALRAPAWAGLGTGLHR